MARLVKRVSVKESMARTKGHVRKNPAEGPSEEELDRQDNKLIDKRLRTNKRIPLQKVLARYGYKPVDGPETYSGMDRW